GGARRGGRRPRLPLVDGRADHPLRRIGRERRLRALLFDLDGTLTRGGGGGGRALAKALHTRPQATEELRKMRLDGMTDRSIARIVLAAEGDQAIALQERLQAVSEKEIDAVLANYLEALAVECAANPYLPQPGIVELLPRLEGRSLLGLCTGNLRS